MARFSANLGFMWPDRPLLERIDAAAAAGFRAIELHWPYDTPGESVRDSCADRGLTLLGINTARGNVAAGDFGLGAVPGREAEFMAAIEQSIAYCMASGASSIHAMAGINDPTQEEAAMAVFRENLAGAAERASVHGLTLLLEPINPRDVPGYFLSCVEAAGEIIEAVGAPNIKIMFDVYHVAIAQGDVLTRLERYLPLIGHVQIAAVPSRHEPDEGEIAYGAIFDALEEHDYGGWIGCEYKPRDATESGLGWVQTLGVRL